MAIVQDDTQGKKGNRSMKGGRIGSNGSVVVYELATNETFMAWTVSDTNWDRTVLTGSDFEDLGPGIQDIIIHVEGSNFSPNFRYKVVLEYKYNNGPWNAASTDLVPFQTTGSYQIGNAFTNRQNLGMKVQIVLYTNVTTGGGPAQRGDLSVSAAVRFFCT